MKGFVGGIPLALLVAAIQVQAMEPGTEMEMGQNNLHQRRTAGFSPEQAGGTAMGGPSGNDEDGTFTTPYSASVHAHTNVNEHYKDNHSVKIKNKHIYPPSYPLGFGPGPALGPGAGPFAHADGPGAGPFPKRSWPAGGTAGGGPSGNDEGQTFNMPITGIFQTEVNEYSKDDHSIHVKNKDIHPGPIIEAPVHPPPHFAGPPGAHAPFRTSGESSEFHIPATAFAKRFSPGGTAMGGPGGGDFHSHESEGEGYPIIAGGTAMGGPSGEDGGLNFDMSQSADIHTNVNEEYKDDHSINIKDTEVYPSPFGLPFKRGLYPHGGGGTALGGPSGNDGGQDFNMPITVETDTTVNEEYQDDHSIHLKHKDVYPAPHFSPFHGAAPFRRAYSPDRVGGSDDDFSDPPFASGGTAMGGPSGDDDGMGFGSATDVGVDTNVNEKHDDNHAIKLDTTTVHPSSWAVPVHKVPETPVHAHAEVPQMPWMAYTDQQHAAGYPMESHESQEIPEPSEPAPPSHRAPEPEASQCSAQVHEVVRTVTETQYKQQQVTETVTQVTQVQATETVTQYKHDRATETVTQYKHDQATETVTQYKEVQATETVTQYKQVQATETVTQVTQVQATETVYQTPVYSHVFQASSIPMQSGSGPKVMSFPASAPSSSNVPYVSYPYPSQSSNVPYGSSPNPSQSSNVPYGSSPHPSQSSNAPAAMFSQIPVHVPVPSPSSSASVMPIVTPSGSHLIPTGVSPEQSAMASSSAHATPHAVMFTGAAARVSGGLVSAAAVVVGVLAFVM
ncbi:hypothetical protein N7520_006217 [Penicillium odoratum]|uniref:uncharacterized protein n=1 Tax=Penicillium odoratum TaxID=1167516 RepID=UPI002546A58A|nr:uncharacterized protein N7520_006217 [Penicillium odoratum]KAJ5759061.1 hypothetical protein N7520_006217 [Penicillium odoratum]